jgi:sugar lactone lactonase YvrE
MIHPRSIVILLAVALICVATKGHAGTLYVTAENGDILTYDTTATNPTPTLFASIEPGFSRGLAIDASGNLYVSNPNSSTIEKFSPTGVDLGAFATGRPEPPV